MKAPATRAGGRYQASERGAFEFERQVPDQRDSDECPHWCYRPFAEFFRQYLRESENQSA